MKKLLPLLFLLLLSFSIHAATLQGTIYNSNFDVETNVVVEIDTNPKQQLLSKDGTYEFEVPVGEYTLTATKGFVESTESVVVQDEGSFTFDVFLLPGFSDEQDLWQDSDTELFAPTSTNDQGVNWRYIAAGIIVILALYRYGKAHKKYGSIRKFKKRVDKESKKSIEEHRRDLNKEPQYIDDALAIIKKHDGRITQKQLRKEMLYLSEAKVSLIVTELEHKGLVEKVKKGRGNVILLK